MRGGDNFEASNEALRQICGAYRVACERWWEFRGSIQTHRIGTLEVADVSVSSCSVIRDHRDEHYRGDQYFLVFQAEGGARMRQRGAEAALGPGDSTVIDSRFPSEFQTSQGFRQYSFHLPVHLFHEQFGKRPVPVAHTIRADRGAGRLLSDMLLSFVHNAPLLQGVELTGLTLQLLSAALGVPTKVETTLNLERRSLNAREIAHYIDVHVERADLTPQTIAAHFNISVRQLYRIIASAGCTPAALIWRNRLEHARRLLGQSGARVPIIEIALSCGFKDGAHFSRAYRKTFGHSPKVSRSTGGGTSTAGLDHEPEADLLTVL